jgi:hypothetical protein
VFRAIRFHLANQSQTEPKLHHTALLSENSANAGLSSFPDWQSLHLWAVLLARELPISSKEIAKLQCSSSKKHLRETQLFSDWLEGLKPSISRN